VLDARGFFPAVRPPEHQNEFGFTIGGPIIKKKAFFFFSYDGWRYRVTSPTQLVSIPTLKERVGDFSELPVAIYDPLDHGGYTRRFLADSIRRSVPRHPSQSAGTEHYSSRQTFQYLKGISTILAPADKFGPFEQLSRASTGGLQQRQLQRQN
jgi:hypothetical protein